jgi:hypothetical protein
MRKWEKRKMELILKNPPRIKSGGFFELLYLCAAGKFKAATA